MNSTKTKFAIELKDVSFQYPSAEKPSVQHIDLSMKEGEFVVLTGGSGCGKTTITRIINGLAEKFYEGISFTCGTGKAHICSGNGTSCCPYRLTAYHALRTIFLRFQCFFQCLNQLFALILTFVIFHHTVGKFGNGDKREHSILRNNLFDNLINKTLTPLFRIQKINRTGQIFRCRLVLV